MILSCPSMLLNKHKAPSEKYHNGYFPISTGAYFNQQIYNYDLRGLRQ
jgi:hypothetical protein